MNGEAVHVSETVGGGAAPAVVKSESVNVNGISVSVTFHGKTSLVNGEVVTASEEGSTVMINGAEMSVTFAASDVLVNGVAVIMSEAATLEAIFPPSIDLNGWTVSVV